MTTADGSENQTHIVFIELLRGIASLIVVWDHLVAIWNDGHGRTYLPLTLMRDYVTKPLGIIQDFGYFGVAIFFFVSGFIITFVAQREKRSSFIIKRVFRIYPPLIVSILIIIAASHLYVRFVNPQAFADIVKLNWKQILFSMTLWNYFFVPQNNVNGVAWSLVIEEIFYAISFILLPLIRDRPRIATLAFSLITFAIIWFGRALGNSFFLFAASSVYIPLLLIGQVTYFLWRGRLRWYEFAGLLVLNYLIFMFGVRSIQVKFYDVTNSYAISSAYAYALFVICLLLNNKIVIPKILKFYSKISYSMYLLHGSNGLMLLSILYPYTGYTLGFFITFGCVTGLSYLSWRYIERTGQVAARALIQRWQQVWADRAQSRQARAAP